MCFLAGTSYEHDVESLYDGARADLREQIVLEGEFLEEEGVLSAETTPDRIADILFKSGQVVTRTHDLTLLGRDRVSSTLYEDLKTWLPGIIDEEQVEFDHTPPDVPNGSNYRVDYRLEASNDRLLSFTEFPIETRHGSRPPCSPTSCFTACHSIPLPCSRISWRSPGLMSSARQMSPEQRLLHSMRKATFAGKS